MNNKKHSKSTALLGAAYFAFAIQGNAFAQTAVNEQANPANDSAAAGNNASSDASPDIVVTANRRAQRIQDVGMAISQFSAADLVKTGATSTADLAQLVPGVYVAGAYGGQSQQYTIRGVTQSDYLDSIENPVAFYIDEVYITSAQGQTMSFMDVDRVEILKGPQGTLFGRNATGGLVQNVVAKPRLNEVSGQGSVTYARFNEVNAQGALNIPLGKAAALRLSALYTRNDDYWTNVYPGGAQGNNPILSFSPNNTRLPRGGDDVGGSESFALRGQLLFEPTPQLTIRLTGSYAKSKMSTAPYTEEATIAVLDAAGNTINELRAGPNETRIAIGPNGVNAALFVPLANGIFTRRVPGGDFFGYVAPDPKTLTLSDDYALSGNNGTNGQVYAAHVDYDLGGAQLSSISSYQKYFKNVYLGDGTAAPALAFGDRSHSQAWSEELRLSGKTQSLQWQTGIFYLDNKVDVLQGIIEPAGSALAGVNAFALGIPALVDVGNQLNTATRFRSKSYSVFGQIEWKFADRWNLIVGGRYIREDQAYSYREFNATSPDPYTMSAVVVAPSFQPDYDNKRSFNLWTAKAQLEFRPVRDLLLYAGVNRGVKAGNYNAPFTFSPADVVPSAQLGYAPETLLSFEGGFKLTHGPLTLNASSFYYDYKNFQAFVFTTASGVVRNVNSQVYGFDVDASLRVATGLRLSGSVGYSHAEIPNFEVAPGVFRAVRPPYSPRLQATGTVDYTVPGDIAGGRVSFNATVNYAGAIYHNIRNFDAQRFAPRTLVNLSATWEDTSNGLSVTVFGKNVFDARYGQLGFDNTAVFGGQNVSFGKPASYGVTVGLKF